MSGGLPVVSVIMPVFNCSNFIAEAVESILGQTLRDFELIIIDDCSTDGTTEIIRGYDDDRIIFIQKPEQSGLVASLNMGIERARGKFIARMDGDDVSTGTRFEIQVAFLDDNPGVVLCGSAIKLSGDGSIAYFPQKHEEIKIYLLDFCPFAHPSVLIRKDFIDKYGLRYLAEFEGAEDYELWTRCVWLGKMVNLPEVLLKYREHGGQVSTSNRPNQLKNSVICRVNMFRKLWEKASVEDKNTRELLFQNQTFTNIKSLNEIIGWMDGLIRLNNQRRCFDLPQFQNFVSDRKKSTIRRFFLYQVTYTPAVMYHLVKTYGKSNLYFSGREYVSLLLKCMTYRRPNTAKS